MGHPSQIFSDPEDKSWNMTYSSTDAWPLSGNTSSVMDVGVEMVNGTNLTDHGNMTAMMGPQSLPAYAQVIITAFYSTVTILAIGGNLIVCYIVLAYQRMRTVTNYFIVNLAVSDLLMAVLCIPFTFVANALILYWPFGAIMCPVVTYAQMVTVFLSAFTLVAISLDRYIAIIYPLRQRMTKKQCILVIALIWLLSLCVCLPVVVLSRVVPRQDSLGVERDSCEETWPTYYQKSIYSMLIMVLQYICPLVVLLFTYTRIGFVIWVKKTPGEAENNRDQRIAAAKRKMVKMMITVVIIYAMCWLPLHAITLLGDTTPVIFEFEYINVVWIACHWLAMSNSCYNPMVYCWMNSRFRNGFRYVFRMCPFVRFDREEHDPRKVKTLHTYVSTVRSGSVHERTRGQCTPNSVENNLNESHLNKVVASPSGPIVYRGVSAAGATGNDFQEFQPDQEEIPLDEVEMPLNSVVVANGGHTKTSRLTSPPRVVEPTYSNEDGLHASSEKALLTYETN